MFTVRCSLFLSVLILCAVVFLFFFFNDTATTEIYTLSLHDALPILAKCEVCGNDYDKAFEVKLDRTTHVFDSFECAIQDRKSTRLNSSHRCISYAVFCLKKKKKQKKNTTKNTYIQSNNESTSSQYDQ